MNKFNENLRKYRKEMKITQTDMAKTLGIAQSTYCGYENGTREPGIPAIKKMAKILGVTGDDLLGITSTQDALAAHFDGDQFTPEEWQEIDNFVNFVKSKRNNQ